MPFLSGMDAGPSPLPAPRELPKGYAPRVLFSHFTVTMGVICFVFSCPILLAILVNRKMLFSSATLFGPLALACVAIVLYRWSRAIRILRVFRHGTPALGEVYWVAVDTETTVERRHPWRLVYHFTVEGEEYEGVVTTFDASVASRANGEPLWVLFAPGNPNQNTLYPAVKGTI
jgi:uncharacterized protein (DUF58 family)